MGFARLVGMSRSLFRAAAAMPVALPALPMPAPAGGLAFSPEGWQGPERRPLRRHSLALREAPPPPRPPLGRYVAQGAAMLLAMALVFWLAALIS